jgi:hypothetical protein
MDVELALGGEAPSGVAVDWPKAGAALSATPHIAIEEARRQAATLKLNRFIVPLP